MSSSKCAVGLPRKIRFLDCDGKDKRSRKVSGENTSLTTGLTIRTGGLGRYGPGITEESEIEGRIKG